MDRDSDQRDAYQWTKEKFKRHTGASEREAERIMHRVVEQAERDRRKNEGER